MAQGERIVEVLKQDRNSPVDVEKQIAILYAVVNNYLQPVDVRDIAEYEQGLYEYLDAHAADLLTSIRETGKLEAEDEQKLKTALETYTKNFLDTRVK